MFKRVVLGTDGSKNSMAAANVCLKLMDKDPETTVTVVHGWGFVIGETRSVAMGSEEPFYLSYQGDSGQPPDMGKKAMDLTMKVFEKYPTRVKSVMKSGDPATIIADIAKAEKADLVVVGHRGLSGIEALLLGSVASNVVHLSPCSVLIVR